MNKSNDQFNAAGDPEKAAEQPKRWNSTLAIAHTARMLHKADVARQKAEDNKPPASFIPQPPGVKR